MTITKTKYPKIMTKVSGIKNGFRDDDTVFKRPLLICSLSKSEYTSLIGFFDSIDEYLKFSSIEEDYEMIFSTYYNHVSSQPDQEVDQELLSSLHNSGQLKEFLIDYGRIQSSVCCEGIGSYNEYIDLSIQDSNIKDEVDLDDPYELINYLQGSYEWEDSDLHDRQIDEQSVKFSFGIGLPQGPTVIFLEDQIHEPSQYPIYPEDEFFEGV